MEGLTIGELAQRSGVATSALRFYESEGLIRSDRTAGNHRRYDRSMLRRVALIRVAQQVGVSLERVKTALHSLPEGRTPNRRDWEKLSRQWQDELDERIALATRLRDQLASCIGCGCLSLRRCSLYNRADALAGEGSGPRRLLEDHDG